MSLADRIGVPSLLPSVSVIDVPQRHLREAGKDEERALEERAKMESGKVERYYDPAAFEWLRPGGAMVGKRHPAVRLQRGHLVIWEFPQVGEWEYAQIGISARALALRKALAGNGWAIKREHKAKYATTFRMSMPKGLAERLQRDGWPFGQTMPAVWDARNEMIVVVRPAEAKGRRAG